MPGRKKKSPEQKVPRKFSKAASGVMQTVCLKVPASTVSTIDAMVRATTGPTSRSHIMRVLVEEGLERIRSGRGL